MRVSVTITTTITGAVNDLYEGTQKVTKGDFSYRIPAPRSDQLGGLAVSFNQMTENLQRLVEVEKERERLQGEIQIAREVQTQLYPKVVPNLKSLALVAHCDPARLVSGELHPNAGKRLLARTIVDLYHGEGAGAAAEAAFDQVFKKHQVPDDVPEFDLAPDQLVDGRIRLARLVALAGLAASNSEARRKIREGAVRLNGERLTDPEAELAPGDLGEGLDGAELVVGDTATGCD